MSIFWILMSFYLMLIILGIVMLKWEWEEEGYQQAGNGRKRAISRWVECDVCNGDGGVPSEYNPPESPDARYPIEYCPTCSGQGGKFVKEVTDG